MNKKDSEKENLIIKICIYCGILIIALLLSRQALTNNKEVKKENNIEENKLLKELNRFNDDLYNIKAHIILDDDASLINYEKQNDIIIGTKYYHNNTTEYIKAFNNYYTIKDNELTKLENFDEFIYDSTFINLENIKELLNSSTVVEKFNSEKYEVYRYKIMISKALVIYNDFNNTNYAKYKDDYIYVDAYYNNDTLDHILLNLKELYNLIFDKEYEVTLISLVITNTEKEDLTWLTEMFN